MDTNDRDTHFKGFARLLFDELNTLYLNNGLDLWLGDPSGEVAQQEITLIAQRAYDLVEHALETCDIPDMTEWPKPD